SACLLRGRLDEPASSGPAFSGPAFSGPAFLWPSLLAMTKGSTHAHRPPGRGRAARAPAVGASQQTAGRSARAWGIAAWEGANPDLAGESPAARLQRRMDNGVGDGESRANDRGQSVAAGRQPGPEG